jgi:hypothetical protein
MGCSHPHNEPTQADLMPPPDDGLNSYSSPHLSVEVGVTLIEAYGRGYVAIDVQLLVSLLDGEDHKEAALKNLNIKGSLLLPEALIPTQRPIT